MGQLPVELVVFFGVVVVVGVVAALLALRMAPKMTVLLHRSTYLLLTLAGSLGTAMAVGVSIALHRWPNAFLSVLNLVALVALLLELRAFESRPRALLRSSQQGIVNGFVFTIQGLSLLTSNKAADRLELGFLLFLATSLAVMLWKESHSHSSSAHA